MNLRVAIHFGSRSLQNTRVHALRQTKHIDSAHHVGLDRLYGIVLVMNRGSRTGKIINSINLQKDWLDHIVTQQLEAMIVK